MRLIRQYIYLFRLLDPIVAETDTWGFGMRSSSYCIELLYYRSWDSGDVVMR